MCGGCRRCRCVVVLGVAAAADGRSWADGGDAVEADAALQALYAQNLIIAISATANECVICLACVQRAAAILLVICPGELTGLAAPLGDLVSAPGVPA